SSARPRAVAAVPSTRGKKTIAGTTANSECLSCHDVTGQIEKQQAGFTHFDSAHRVVLQRKFECVQCHAMPMPFDAETHHVDRMAQIKNCKTCHVAR
ncbi:MAG: hypothetical protein ACRD4K_15570, partial [Candidatus Acidiferrales bacterium]